MQTLKNRKNLVIRFSDVDVLGIVWHGNYLYYFEDGREAFGDEFGLSYYEIYGQGYITPIVHAEINYKQALIYRDEVFIETAFVNSEAAKIILDYKIFRTSDNKEMVTGRTIQVFLDLEKQLVLTNPPFFLEWKKKFNLI